MKSKEGAHANHPYMVASTMGADDAIRQNMRF